MDHQDHVHLLRGAVTGHSGVWADFGSGDGAFTLALRDLAGAKCEIFSVEKDRARLEQQKKNFQKRFPESHIHFLNADFTQPLGLPPLDGIVMANALHFFREKEQLLRQLRGYLKNAGRLVIVEYNVDSGNYWVPHPISFETFRPLALRAGFAEPELVATKPSSFLREIYSAVTIRSLEGAAHTQDA